jgi:peroxiredoxin
MGRYQAGDVIDRHELPDIRGAAVPVPADRLVHLQFRRYSGCPVCNLHLRQLATRHAEITGAGITEVVVFHSTAETMLELQGDLPFAAVADPGQQLYREFGVGRIGLRNFWIGLTPRSWRGAITALRAAPSLRSAYGRGERHLGLPAEFLIAPDGRVLVAHYGRYLDDHWSVDELLALGAASTSPAG